MSDAKKINLRGDSYREAKGCGLTALMQGFVNEAQVRKCLDTAQRVGIKLLLSNRKLFEKDGSQLAAAVKDHPALMGRMRPGAYNSKGVYCNRHNIALIFGQRKDIIYAIST